MADTYFVTGATGAIGSALIPLLLEDKNAQILLLLRADTKDHLRERLADLIAFWEMSPEQVADAERRILSMQGDTDQERFGLCAEDYAIVVKSTTHIIHCAGVVRMNLPLEEARLHALGSVKNLVELCMACRSSGGLQKVEYVSTVGVAGRMSGLAPEAWITQPRLFHNSYEQSKAEAEDYLMMKMDEYRLPVTVHRPSMVVGDSKTGKIIHYQIFYHICEFLSGRRTFGFMPYLYNARLDTVPVDFVAESIKFSSSRQSASGRVMHLCSGPERAVKLTDLRRMVRAMMRDRGMPVPVMIKLPVLMFNALLIVITPFLNEKMQRTVKSFPFFLDYLTDSQAFANQNTSDFLGQRAKEHLSVALAKYLDSKMTRNG